MRFIGVSLLILLAIFLVISSGKDRGTNQSARNDFCDKVPSVDINKVIADWMRLGVIVEQSGDKVVVEDRAWDQAPHRAKVSIAIAYHCRMNGAYVRIVGYRDGKQKAYMMDGNYWD